jgi:heptaprenyl diphosphate synthase
MKNKYVLMKISYTALLLSFALIVGYLEAIIPPIFPYLPFFRIGLSNIIIILSILLIDIRASLIIALLKSIIVPLFTGNIIMVFYSLPASLVSLGLTIILMFLKKVSIPSISIISAITHNIVQVVIASILMGSNVVYLYIPYLLIAGILSGGVVGIFSYFIIKVLPNKLFLE